MARPPLQQHGIRNESFVRAGVTARHHQVEDAQILEPESVSRGHGRACHFPSREHIERKMNMSNDENPDASLPYLPWARGIATLG
jgi:hypothetical protein